MASIKISNLNQTTGYTISDVVAIVDSGSTETKKITTGHLFNNFTGRIADETSQDTNTFIGAGSDVNSSSTESRFQGSTKFSGVMYGIGQLNNSSDAIIMASTGGSSSVTGDNISASLILGGFRSSMTNTTRAVQIVSQDVSLSTSYNSSIIGCEGGSINGSYKSTLVGNGNSTINNSTEAFLVGSRNSSIDLAGGNSGSIIGSKSSSISLPSPSAELNGIYSSDNSTINTSGIQSVIINSKTANITASVQGATMVSTDTQNALHDWALHADNMHTFKTESFNVVDAGDVAGTIDVDCSAGTIFKFRIVGDTTPNFINVKTGQRFIFIVENAGSFTVPTATVGGIGGTVFAKNGSLNPSNAGFTKYNAVYDGSNMFLNEELGFAPV